MIWLSVPKAHVQTGLTMTQRRFIPVWVVVLLESVMRCVGTVRITTIRLCRIAERRLQLRPTNTKMLIAIAC